MTTTHRILLKTEISSTNPTPKDNLKNNHKAIEYKRRFIPSSCLGKIAASPLLVPLFLVVGVPTVLVGIFTIGRINIWNMVFAPYQTQKRSHVKKPENKYENKKEKKKCEIKEEQKEYKIADNNKNPIIPYNALFKGQLLHDKTFYTGISNTTFSNCNICSVTFSTLATSGIVFSNCLLQSCEFNTIYTKKAKFIYHHDDTTKLHTAREKYKLYHNTNFSDCTLQNSRFDNINLEKCYFTNCDLNYARFENVIFNCSSFKNCNLQNAHFSRNKNILGIDYYFICDFSKSNLKGATFINFDIRDAVFENIICDEKTSITLGAIMADDKKSRDYNFSHLSSDRYNPTDPCNPTNSSVFASIHHIPKQYKKLRHNLMQQVFQQINNSQYKNNIIQECWPALFDILTNNDNDYLEIKVCQTFFDNHLNGQSISLPPMLLDDSRNRDKTLNHIHNNRSILTDIAIIPKKYNDLRHHLIKQIFQQINDSQYKNDIIQECWEPILDVLVKENNAYLGIKICHLFFTNSIMPILLEKSNNSLLRVLEDKKNALSMLLDSFESYINNEKEKLITYNFFFMQVLYFARKSQDNKLIKKANKLFKNYINSMPNNLKNCFNVHYIEEILLIKSKNNNEYKNELKETFEDAYLWIDENHSSIIFTHKYACNLFNTLDKTDYSLLNLLYFFKNEKKVYKSCLFNVDSLTNYPLINNYYQQVNKNKLLKTFINNLTMDKSYATDFVKALSNQSSNKKLTAINDQTKLAGYFKKLYAEETKEPVDLTLSDSFLNSLNKTHLNERSKEYKSLFFLCFSTIFARYSSSYIFGSEHDSPEPIRTFAWVLLKQAKIFNQNIVSDTKYQDWKNRLLGLNKAFTCTAVLSGAMKRVIEESNGKKILDEYYPLAWR